MTHAPPEHALTAHLRPEPVRIGDVTVAWTAGCRGHPEPPPGWDLLARAAAGLVGDVLDASGLLGAPGRAAAGGGARTRVLEPSAAGLAAARRDPGSPAAVGAGDEPGAAGALRIEAGLPWDAPAAAFDAVLLAPPAERGSARVRAELDAAARALRPGGDLWLLLDKDRGAKRYEKEAAARVGPLEVVGRHKGWRLSRARREPDAGPGPAGDADGDAPWLEFDTPRGPAAALPGAFAAGKLDPGAAVLLDVLEAASADVGGAEVLDLGCGWGPLSRWAAAAGGRVVATDDDLAAVRSTRRNAPAAEVLHADLDGGLAQGRRFDRVLVNPPFHLGAGVRMRLPAAFLAAAARRVRRDGEIWVVANEALPYGPLLEAAGLTLGLERRERGFRVWRASPRRRR